MSSRFVVAVPAAFLLAAGLLVTQFAGVVAGGGGCHAGGVTDAKAVAVDLSASCFTPTVVRVDPGSEVTWTNRDSYDHTVTGVAGSWGTFDTLAGGASVTYRFEKAGVYPYFCLLHPGMVGAVVVGDGTPAAAAGVVASSVAPLSPAPAASVVEPAAASDSVPSAPFNSIVPALGLALLAGVAGYLLALLPRRRTSAR